MEEDEDKAGVVSKTYAYFMGTIVFVLFSVILYQAGAWAPFLWTSADEIVVFTETEELEFRNLQGALELIGIFIAGWLSMRTYRKALIKK